MKPKQLDDPHEDWLFSRKHPSHDVIILGQNLQKKNTKFYHITWRPWVFKTSTFDITWCDNFAPNLRLEVAEGFTWGGGCWLPSSCNHSIWKPQILADNGVRNVRNKTWPNYSLFLTNLAIKLLEMSPKAFEDLSCFLSWEKGRVTTKTSPRLPAICYNNECKIFRCPGLSFLAISLVPYCRDQNYSGSGKIFPGINFWKITDFIAG